MKRLSIVSSVAALAFNLGCEGGVSTGPSNGDPGGNMPGAAGSGMGAAGGSSDPLAGAAGSGALPAPPAGTPNAQSACATGVSDQPGTRIVRRLTQNEYNQTLVDVFGATNWVDITFPGEVTRLGAYETLSEALNVTEPVAAVLIEETFARAETLFAGDAAVPRLVTGCTAGSIDAACVTEMVKHYGYRLFRRPLTEQEVQDYTALFTQAIGELAVPADQALSGTMAALMQSPHTLYIEQLGTAAGEGFVLGPYETASILSYGLTGTAPTAEFLDRVSTGALTTPAGIQAEVQALLQSPAGQVHLRKFLGDWLAYEEVQYVAKNEALYPFPEELTAAMAEETRLFLEGILAGSGGVDQLLLSPATHFNETLAAHYGVAVQGATADTFVAASRPEGAGFLTQGAFLARHALSDSSSPTQRGLFILRHLLCVDLPPPPPNIPDIVPPTEAITTRERYEEVHGVGGCAGCHARMDRLGFALENFDSVGRYRTEEVGKPIDASGSVVDLGDAPFVGSTELAALLAAEPRVHQCVAAHMSSFMFGVSVRDGLCVAPAATYATGAQGFAAVLGQVATAPHVTSRR